MTGKRKPADLGDLGVWGRIVAMLRADDYSSVTFASCGIDERADRDYRTCPTRACRTMIPLTLRQASLGQLVFCPRCGEPLGPLA